MPPVWRVVAGAIMVVCLALSAIVPVLSVASRPGVQSSRLSEVAPASLFELEERASRAGHSLFQVLPHCPRELPLLGGSFLLLLFICYLG